MRVCRTCAVAWLDSTDCWACGQTGDDEKRGQPDDAALLSFANWSRPRIPEDGLDFLTMAVA